MRTFDVSSITIQQIKNGKNAGNMFMVLTPTEGRNISLFTRDQLRAAGVACDTPEWKVEGTEFRFLSELLRVHAIPNVDKKTKQPTGYWDVTYIEEVHHQPMVVPVDTIKDVPF